MSPVNRILLHYRPPLHACTLALDMWASAVRHILDPPTPILEAAVMAVEAELAVRPGAAARIRYLSPAWRLRDEPLCAADYAILRPLADAITAAMETHRRFGPLPDDGYVCPCVRCGAARGE
ncbi:hypothetical protein BOTBODRAFT_182213 [Botryobasidium botryosum FD-172 SS1]|uniref:Uncharacterized protein n=1 Tax=Botryobasidium botryosum (strain FD-172 SS1) TaxID=930990 RepID=A0A067LUB8_BOTB1|nr:hypothetical protein BOTBODRAFT_182213 [Botryobasidium botryosum FD-172 SS1]